MVEQLRSLRQSISANALAVKQEFSFLGQVIMGRQEAITLVITLSHKFFIPNLLGDIRASGLLPQLIQSVGSVDEFRVSTSNIGDDKIAYLCCR